MIWNIYRNIIKLENIWVINEANFDLYGYNKK